MNKSMKKEKELDRSYDYTDAYGFANVAANVGFVKKEQEEDFIMMKRRASS